MPRHLVLVGLPGSGKSTVGRLVSKGLPAPLIDIDQLLVRQLGRPVSQIFGMIGEVGFRQMEREAVRAALMGVPAVVVPGGGWAAQPGEIEQVAESCFIIYLKSLPGTAAQRIAEGTEGEARPLMAGGDPFQRMRELFQAREPFYAKAHVAINADIHGAAAVAAAVIAEARRGAGW